jgi:hypothetical protein
MWFRARPLLSKLLIVPSALLLLTSLVGCSSDADPPAAICGGVERGGVCYAKCVPTDCSATQKCVAPDGFEEGGCFATCTTAANCGIGQSCLDRTDMQGAPGKFCMARSQAKDPATQLPFHDGKVGDVCSGPVDCDAEHDVRCVSGTCTVGPGQEGELCAGDANCDAGKGLKCQAGACTLVPSGPGEPCSDTRSCVDGLGCHNDRCLYGCDRIQGSCAEGYECLGIANQAVKGVCVPVHPEAGDAQYGAACPAGATSCNADAGFVCVGTKGDANAYCSKKDGCTTDEECPSGFWCGATTSPKGKTDIDFDNPVRICMRREFCGPCNSDVDCSYQLGAICAPDINGEKFCSLPCDPEKNSCIIGASCITGDDGGTFCRPDVGYCHSAEPKGCDPCRIDADCGPNSLCREGSFGYKPTVRWCSTPCGEPDEDGKNPCPVAPNGNEMVCLDENLLTLGGPIDSTASNAVYKHCYSPFTVDNSQSANGADPGNGACGNARREGAEECDDNNTSTADGCGNDCLITEKCRFTVGADNGDGTPTLMQNGAPVAAIGSSCKSFLVEGSIEAAGDIDAIPFKLPDGQYAWVDVFTDAPGTCNADLVAEARAGEIDLNIPCEKLSTETMDLANSKLCSDGKLGCGSCTTPGICGTCDDDSGIGNCPRMLINTSTSYGGQYAIKYDSVDKVIRIYARDPAKTVDKYVVIVSRLPYDAAQQSPKYGPGLSCY